MQIIEDKALVFKTRNPDRYSIIPKSKVIPRDDGGYDVAVYWGLDEVRVLKNLGVKNVPSPITKRYSWRSSSQNPVQARRYLLCGQRTT